VKVLVACEFSGAVRDAFKAAGHDAWSCDLLATEAPGQHIQGDVLEAIRGQHWDLMVAHPPCTYLSSSGLHWNHRRPGRAELTEAALDFVRALLDAPIEKIALENPVGCISSRICKPDQIIQPWQFGHADSKATCLWLKNLPPLVPTEIIVRARYDNQTPNGQNKLPPSPDRWKERSRTYEGIALAMAQQWGAAVIAPPAKLFAF
jgi:site-specific DNA-cytosine methylase